MRTLETLLVLACLWTMLRLANHPVDDRLPATLACVVIVLLAAQLVFEGWRTPFLPVYPVAVGLLAWAWLFLPLRGPQSLVAAGLVLLLLGAAVGGCLILPSRILRPLEGPYPVGTVTMELDRRTRSDTASRYETFRPEPSVRLWYPAQIVPVRLGRELHLSARMRERLREVQLEPAIDGAPVGGKEPVPVLIYFPGWPGTRLQNLSLVRELASQGYLVASVEYPARTPGTSDGTFEDEVRRLDRPMQNYASDALFHESLVANDERLRHNVDDVSRILTRLTVLNGSGPANRLTGRLNLGRVGIVGYSFGGAVAAEARRLDPRIKAAVNIDGRHYGSALSHGVPAPYMFVGEELLTPSATELHSPDPATRYEAMLDEVDYANLAKHLRENGGIQVTVANTTHPNFCDDVLRSPVTRLTGGGRIDAQRALDILNRFVVNFFDRVLRDGASPMLTAPSPTFPEVRVDVYRQ